MPRPVSYDDVPYPRFAFEQTRPQRLAAIARLAGLPAAAPEGCRTLEIGCASGANLIPMALALPQSEFVGVDLSAGQIARAAEVACDLGLTNIRFEAADILTWPEPDGRPPQRPFDYIIAHGVYSWTPPAVRSRLLELCGQWLAPGGVAYVSYKAYPGGHASDMMRQMSLFANREVDDPRRWSASTREFLGFLQRGMPERDSAYRAVVLQQTALFNDEDPDALVHDELEADCQPCYFHEFMRHAAEHGLQYLGDADYAASRGAGVSPEALDHLCPGDDLVEREQYLDFVYGRAFRATLLCRREAEVDRSVRPERVLGLMALGDIRTVDDQDQPIALAATDLAGEAPWRFRVRHGVLAADDPVDKALLSRLAANYPRGVAARDLAAQAAERLAAAGVERPTTEVADDWAAGVAERLARWCAEGTIELIASQPEFTLAPGDRPVASPLARHEAARGWRITSLLHHHVTLADPAMRQLLIWLDGGQSRAELAARLAKPALSGRASIEVEGRRLVDKRAIRRAFAKFVDDCLERFARDGLLIA